MSDGIVDADDLEERFARMTPEEQKAELVRIANALADLREYTSKAVWRLRKTGVLPPAKD